MPDAAGNIRGITVPNLPPSMQRCENSGLTKPECPCPECKSPAWVEEVEVGPDGMILAGDEGNCGGGSIGRDEPPDLAA
jgi:hypothetical protein